MLGLQTDSPSQRQPRLAHAEASTGDTQASPHGSSSEVQRGRELLSNLAIDSGRPMRSPSLAPNMERRGVAAPPDGFPASIMMPNSNVRSDGLPDVSQPCRDFAQPHEELWPVPVACTGSTLSHICSYDSCSTCLYISLRSVEYM